MVLGDILIKLSALCAAVAFVSAIRWARGRPSAERTFRWAYHGMTATLLLASALLMVAILRHDFRFEYVIGYSSRDLPLIYLVSAFWAGQSGTYLLWGLFGAILGYALIRRGAWEPASVMTFYLPTVAFMHALMLDPAGNPFTLAASVPPDGRGLNPLLQDPWMASHPPMIFLGYAAMAIPAALAMVALLKRCETRWIDPALRWSLLSFILLGVGIVLGGFWAYKVLGWGGYWGWDPVENASLIPWLLVTALIHALLVQKAVGALPRASLILALAGYVTVFYATFLTRSGVLADFSVHSFPAGSIYRILLGIQLLIVAASILAIFRGRSISGREIGIQPAWPFTLAAVVVLFSVSAGFIVIGTSWPILTSAIGQPSSFGPAWYNTVSQPIYIVALALLGVAPFLAWAVRPWRMLSARLLTGIAVAGAGTVLAVVLGARGFVALALFFVSLAALAANTMRLLEIGRTRLLNGGAALAHIGFALMFVGIIGSSFWGRGERIELPQGQPVEVLERSLTFTGHVDGSEPQDRWRIRFEEPGRDPFTADVGMFRTGPSPDAEIMHKPAIVRRFGGDLYVAPGGLRISGGHQDLTLIKEQPVSFGDATLTFREFKTEGMGDGYGMVVWAHVTLQSGDRSETLALPYKLTEGQPESLPVRPTIDTGITLLALEGMSVEQGSIAVHVETGAARTAQILSVDVSTKPMIGLLWAGTILLGVGCGVAWARRSVDERLMARARVGAAPTRRVESRKKDRKRAASRPAHARQA